MNYIFFQCIVSLRRDYEINEINKINYKNFYRIVRNFEILNFEILN